MAAQIVGIRGIKINGNMIAFRGVTDNIADRFFDAFRSYAMLDVIGFLNGATTIRFR